MVAFQTNILLGERLADFLYGMRRRRMRELYITMLRVDEESVTR